MTARTFLVSTIRSTTVDTFRFINYHLNIGVDELMLFFDDPEDQSFVNVCGFNRVRPVLCDDTYWQRHGGRPVPIEERQEINANVAFQLATSMGFDWVIHIDSDELIATRIGLKSILESCSGDVVRFLIREAVCTREEYESIFDATSFKVFSKDVRLYRQKIAKVLGCKSVFFLDEYFRGHGASKAAVRISSKIRSLGLHGPKVTAAGASIIEITAPSIVLLHYDCVGIEAWRTKWRRRMDGSGTAIRIRTNRREQFEYFKRVCGDKYAERMIYNKLHRISRYQHFVLRMCGLIKVVKLNSRLFDRDK
jgi:Glycosyl transferase family 2